MDKEKDNLQREMLRRDDEILKVSVYFRLIQIYITVFLDPAKLGVAQKREQGVASQIE